MATGTELILGFEHSFSAVLTEQAFLGVAITGRCFPTFADWRNENGKLYPIVYNTDLNNTMHIAKTRIVEVLPCFEKAVWCVKEKFY